MKTYSRSTVVLCCAMTAVLTVALLLAFRMTLWPQVKHRLGFGGSPPQGPRPLELKDPQTARILRERYDDIVSRRNSMVSAADQERIMRLFIELKIWENMYWLGIPALQLPSDMCMMQQVISEVQPDYVIETGAYYGGSSLYFASVLDSLDLPDAKVITIDIENKIDKAARFSVWQTHVEFVLGSSTDPQIVSRIANKVKGKKVIVFLDTLKTKDHVSKELKAYSPLVSKGSYIVVEDTSLDSMPLSPELGPGPMAAVKDFLSGDDGADFHPDVTREAFLYTYHPGGWLKRGP